MTVFVCVVNSTFYDDSLLHIDRVYENRDQAEAWESNYGKEMEEDKKIILIPPKDGSDKELDKYLLEKEKLTRAEKFISAEIKPFRVL